MIECRGTKEEVFYNGTRKWTRIVPCGRRFEGGSDDIEKFQALAAGWVRRKLNFWCPDHITQKRP